MKLIKEHKYISKDMVETTLKVFKVEIGIVLEQTRRNVDEIEVVDSVFIPKEVFEND